MRTIVNMVSKILGINSDVREDRVNIIPAKNGYFIEIECVDIDMSDCII